MPDFKYDGRGLCVGSGANRLLALVGTNKDVLEVGCATGYMSRILVEQQGCRVTGIELDSWAAEQAAAFCSHVICGDVEELVFPPDLGPFDVIIFSDVLEHLRRPEKTLRRVSSFLKEDGFVLASIPNVTHLSVVLEIIQGRFLYNTIGLLDDTHLRFFCRDSVEQLFNSAGLRVCHWERVSIPPELTEFKSDLTSFPREFIEHLEILNPEHNTYQFVVLARMNTGLAEHITACLKEPGGEEETVSGGIGNRAIFDAARRARDREKSKDLEIARLRQVIKEKEQRIQELCRQGGS